MSLSRCVGAVTGSTMAFKILRLGHCAGAAGSQKPPACGGTGQGESDFGTVRCSNAAAEATTYVQTVCGGTGLEQVMRRKQLPGVQALGWALGRVQARNPCKACRCLQIAGCLGGLKSDFKGPASWQQDWS